MGTCFASRISQRSTPSCPFASGSNGRPSSCATALRMEAWSDVRVEVEGCEGLAGDGDETGGPLGLGGLMEVGGGRCKSERQ